MNQDDIKNVIKYLKHQDLFIDDLYTVIDEKGQYLKDIYDSYGFKLWLLQQSFNKLSEAVKKQIEPALKKLLFNGKVK